MTVFQKHHPVNGPFQTAWRYPVLIHDAQSCYAITYSLIHKNIWSDRLAECLENIHLNLWLNQLSVPLKIVILRTFFIFAEKSSYESSSYESLNNSEVCQINYRSCLADAVIASIGQQAHSCYKHALHFFISHPSVFRSSWSVLIWCFCYISELPSWNS